MARRALVIGSEIAGLTGVTRDLDIVGALLGQRGFDVRRHERATATRDAIGDALQDLATDTAPGDAVVVYYSGHGGRAVDNSTDPARGPVELQFIAPYDFELTTADDFRAVTALELSAHVQAISARTENVSVILDCCYSSRMARDVNLVPRAIPRVSYVDVARHLARVGVDGLARSLNTQVEGNPAVVRLVAAGPTEQAFEYPSPHGQVGLLTEGMRRILDATGDAPLTWAALVRSLRPWVQVLATNQRPEAEGPADRVLFTTERVDLSGVVPVRAVPGGAELAVGRLAGVGVGDVYVVLDAGQPDPARPLARLTVDAVTATTAHATLWLADAVPALPPRAEARPVSRAARRRLVVVTGTGLDANALRSALAASRHVAPASTVDADQPVLAAVAVGPDGVALADAGGPITPPAPMGDATVVTLVRNLERLARAADLRALDSGDPVLAAALDVGWGHVVDGAEVVLPPSGATVFPGDRIWVRLRNTGSTRIFAFVYSVGGGGDIALLTNADPSGLPLDPGQEWVVGRRAELGYTTGLQVSWPRALSATVRRPESVVVIATSRRQDLQALTQEGVRGRRGSESPLEALLGQIGDGGARGIEPDPDPGTVRYAVRHIEYLLEPADRPRTDVGSFVLDERPDLSLALVTPRSAVAAPSKVAVRLAQLVVHRNRAFGTADLRLDALVVTAGPDGEPVPKAGTWRFPRVHDGQRLSFDNLLLAHGPVHDYLDIAVWLSRDRTKALDLASLLDRQLNDPAFVQAAGALALAASPLAAAIASLGAVGTLVDLAYRALAAAVGDGIGVYRTSFLAHEAFGLGDHPVGGLRTEQDMAFRFRIEEG